jgi:hypothetical protein
VLDGGKDAAVGFAVVLAVAKSALAEQRSQFEKGLRNVLRRQMAQAECGQSRRVDQRRGRTG